MEKIEQIGKARASVFLFALLAVLSLLLLGGRQAPAMRDAVHRTAQQIAAESASFEDGSSSQLVEKRPVVLLRANAIRHP